MEGYAGYSTRVFIENKFEAELTPNQPTHYLKLLAKQQHPTLLLLVAPAARQKTLWRHLCEKAKVSNSKGGSDVVGVRVATISQGLKLALTSWDVLLSAIKRELADVSQTLNDLSQLRALCGAIDQVFVPVSSEQIKNKEIPTRILHLSSIARDAVEIAENGGVLNTESLREKSAKAGKWDSFGRYVNFPNAKVGAWFGIDFPLWKHYGLTPLWLVFYESEWGRAREVQDVLEKWIKKNGDYAEPWNDEGYSAFAVGIKLPVDKRGVVSPNAATSVVKQLEAISKKLSRLGHKRI